MEFTPEEKKILMAIGRSEQGRNFISILENIKQKMSDIDGITDDYAAQVEGRKIFKKFCGTLIDSLQAKPKSNKPIAGSSDYD